MKPGTMMEALWKFAAILLIGLICFGFSEVRFAVAAEIPLIALDEAVHWSLFNLVVVILNALIAFALLVRYFFFVRRGNRLGRGVRAKSDGDGVDGAGGADVGGVGGAGVGDAGVGVGGIGAGAGGAGGAGDMSGVGVGMSINAGDNSASGMNAGAEQGVRTDQNIPLFNRVFTDVCVLLAVVGFAVFFIVERLDTLMAVFDFLSPLFGALFVLIVLAAILAILKTSEETAFESQNNQGGA